MTVPAQTVLDREFLEFRARVLELAAALDRLDRSDGPGFDQPPLDQARGDARLAAMRKGIDVLVDGKPNRAERVQLVFSLQYDPAWRQSLGVLQR